MTSPARFKPFSLKLPGGRLLECRRPQVMGIINVTPDSFYSGSRSPQEIGRLMCHISEMVGQGVDIIDIGAVSTRPGADSVDEATERERLKSALEAVKAVAPTIPVSVDTYRSSIARWAVEEMGTDIINDVSGGNMDEDMFQTIANLKVPYVLMHMRGTPQDMMEPNYLKYDDLVHDVLTELAEKVSTLAMMGVADVIVDPGFGFSKDLNQNFVLLRELPIFHLLHRPLLVGMSRKSMLQKAASTDAGGALESTVAANTIALAHGGASILRVHDVAAGRQTVSIFEKTFLSSAES